MRRKLQSILLVLCMICSLLPSGTAHAAGENTTGKPYEVTIGGATTGYDTFEEAWESAAGSANTAGATVTLYADVTAEYDTAAGIYSFGAGSCFGPGSGANVGDQKNVGALLVPSGKTITLDLNGHMINRAQTTPVSNGYVMRVMGTLTLTDTSAAKTGKLTGGNDSEVGGISVYGSSATLIMEGGMISGNKGSGVMPWSSGSFEMKGGTISGNTGYGVNWVSSGYTLEFSGAPVITGNTAGNLRLASGETAAVSALAEGANIGVTTSYNPTEGNPVNITSAADADYSSFFTSDNTNYYIANSGTGSEQVVQLKLGGTEYNVTLPDVTGATVTAAAGSTSPVEAGGSYSFTVTVAGGYHAANLVVKANNYVLTAEGGVYTISDIQADQTITIEGVEACTYGPAWSKDETNHWKACTCDAKTEFAAHTWNADAATQETDKHCTVCGYVAQAILPSYEVTIGETTTNYTEFEAAWEAANESTEATVKLYKDAVAAYDAAAGIYSFGTGSCFGPSFGENSDKGAILVPSGRTITLDLNGYKINRAQDISVPNGYVMRVMGNLTLTDTSVEKTGMLTGGNDSEVGGISVYEGTLIMEGGTIGQNKGTGVVPLHGGTFTMKGGSISGNTEYGVYNMGGTVILSGMPVITGNESGNLYLNYGERVLVSALTEGAEIGVTSYPTPTAAAPVTITTDAIADYSSYFTSDDPNCYIAGNDTGEAYHVQLKLKNTETAPTGVGKTDCTTAANNDGTITGVDDTMEYKLSTAMEYTAITGTSVTGLANGTYQVRVKGTATTLPSAPVEVTIAEYAEYTVTLPTVTGLTIAPMEGAASPVARGGSYSFSVTLENDYHITTDFKVKANGTVLTAVADGEYTISDIQQNQNITIEGVAACTPGADDGDCTTDIICSVCEEVTTKGADSHTWSTTYLKENADAEKHYHVCTVCTKTTKDAGVAHDWNVEAATEETDKHCKICGYVAEAKLDHVHSGTLVPKKDATCVATGTKAYYSCTCGKYFEDAACTKEITDLNEWKVIALAEHTYNKAQQDDNQHWSACSVCGAVGAKTMHSFTWVLDKVPTDSEAGSRHEQCTVCGYKRAAVEIPATGTNDTDDSDNSDDSAPSTTPTQPSVPGTGISPKTGDNSNPALWSVLLLIACGSLIGVCYDRRKRQIK